MFLLWKGGGFYKLIPEFTEQEMEEVIERELTKEKLKTIFDMEEIKKWK